MYTIGAVIMRFRPPFFCFIPIFSKDFKKCSQDVPFLNLAVLFSETTELITVSQISVPRPDLPHTNPSCETNLVSELKSEKQFRKGVSPGDGHKETGGMETHRHLKTTGQGRRLYMSRLGNEKRP